MPGGLRRQLNIFPFCADRAGRWHTPASVRLSPLLPSLSARPVPPSGSSVGGQTVMNNGIREAFTLLLLLLPPFELVWCGLTIRGTEWSCCECQARLRQTTSDSGSGSTSCTLFNGRSSSSSSLKRNLIENVGGECVQW